MFEDQLAALEAREAELVPFLQGCLVGARAQGTVCGLPVAEAPDPWLAADGTPCRGFSTRSTREPTRQPCRMRGACSMGFSAYCKRGDPKSV